MATSTCGAVKRTAKFQRYDNVHSHIFTPRTYLVELLNTARERNSIICLGSSSGKAFIGVHLLKELAKEIRIDYANGGKRSVYLINDDDMIDEHVRIISMHTDLTVTGYHEDDLHCSNFSPDDWKTELTRSSVLVMAPSIFLHVLSQVSPSIFNLVILDDCHLAIDSHPYVEIMERINAANATELNAANDKYGNGEYKCKNTTRLNEIRIVGLTASLLSGELCSVDNLEMTIHNLEKTLACSAEMASDAIVADLYGTKPQESMRTCKSYSDSTGLIEKLGCILQSTADFLELVDIVSLMKNTQTKSAEATVDDEKNSPCNECADGVESNKEKKSFSIGHWGFEDNAKDSEIDKCDDNSKIEISNVINCESNRTGVTSRNSKLDCRVEDIAELDSKNQTDSMDNIDQDKPLKDSNCTKQDIHINSWSGDTLLTMENNIGNSDNRVNTIEVADKGLDNNSAPGDAVSKREDSINTAVSAMDGLSISNASYKSVNDTNNHINESSTNIQPSHMVSEATPRKDPKSGARLVLNECLSALKELGPWCCARLAQAFIKQLGKVEPVEEDESTKCFLQLTATTLRIVQRIADNQFDKEVQCLEQFLLYLSPKCVELVNILHEHKPDDNFIIIGGGGFSDCEEGDESDDSMDDEAAEKSDENTQCVAKKRTAAILSSDDSTESSKPEEEGLCGIVFVERRHTAFVLNKLLVELCNWDPDLYHVRSVYMSGGSSSTSNNSRHKRCANDARQEEILRKFRTREMNLLVSTGVLEEGIDLPRCNVIIRFDEPTTYRSYVQSKGRARGSNAKYYMLVSSDEEQKFLKALNMYNGIERILLDRCHNVDDYSKEPLYEGRLEELHSPFKPGTGPACVSLSTAIKLVNRYCAKLPSDTFTHLTPKCYVEEVVSNIDALRYRARLQLPINSPIKEPIIGHDMPSKRLSQMDVALTACEILHKAGELDDSLQPVGKELIRYEYEESEWEDHELHGQARPGTTKRKQYYEKRIARSLLGRPIAEQRCFLYNFAMKLTCPITEEQNTRGRVIHPPENTTRNFGILSLHQIPAIPSFPVFTRCGEVTVVLEEISVDLILSADDLKRLTQFHQFIFSHILRLEKAPMFFDPEAAKSSVIVVPLNTDDHQEIVIDWPFIETIEQSNLLFSRGCPRKQRKDASPSDSQNRASNPGAKPFLTSKYTAANPFIFNEEVFGDAVVMPSYRNVDQPQYFYVAEIHHELNPRSAFPSPELYETFEHYYTSKYGLQLTNLTQPLLDVDHTSARLNLLTPRYMNQKGVALPTSSAATRRAKRENLQQKQILVPELCDVHPVPASLWRKAVCIPAILYRLNYLLVADELRVQIAQEALIGGLIEKEATNQMDILKFPPLKFRGGVCDVCQCNFKDSKVTDVNCGTSMHSISQDSSVVSDVNNDTIGRNFVFTAIGCENSKNSIEDNTELVKSNCTSREGNTEVESPKNTCTDIISNRISEITRNHNSLSSKNTQNGIILHSECEKLKIDNQQDEKCVCHNELNEFGSKVGNLVNGITSNNLESKVATNSQNNVAAISESKEESTVENSVTDIEMCSKHSHIQADSLAISNQSGSCKCRYIKQSTFSLDSNSTVGPSPCDIVQTLTMSNANDFFNLERLETIGDSFLKFAITVYLYCKYPGIHEGKLSYLRSIQVSNYNLYRLGKRKGLPECMVAVKFEPMENWLPPGYSVRTDTSVLIQEPRPLSTSSQLSQANNAPSKSGSLTASLLLGRQKSMMDEKYIEWKNEQQRQFTLELEECIPPEDEVASGSSGKIVIPYNLQTQHSLPDKSIADCVEALIGCYLSTCGLKAALQFMAWLDLKVLPPSSLPTIEPQNYEHAKTDSVTLQSVKPESSQQSQYLSDVGDVRSSEGNSAAFGKSNESESNAGSIPILASPLLSHVTDAHDILEHLLNGYEKFEDHIQYKFRDRSYLLQAFTHASYHYNIITDCYQRLEFLGDAILDYVITRHLFEDSIKHSPGILTDLRSALVNNNIFATLAVKWNFHKYFKAISPQLFHVIDMFVAWQSEKTVEMILDPEEAIDSEDGEEDIEIPKALGDIFESVAGAIYLDSGMSLDTVWRVYYRMMKPHIDSYMDKIPKSPVRELLEMEPETAKFEKPERTIEGKIRVKVNVVGKGMFAGVGRNYRIAKSAAAKRALKQIKLMYGAVSENQLNLSAESY